LARTVGARVVTSGEELWRNVGDDGVRRAAYRGG
jgi:hypothetical protein